MNTPTVTALGGVELLDSALYGPVVRAHEHNRVVGDLHEENESLREQLTLREQHALTSHVAANKLVNAYNAMRGALGEILADFNKNNHSVGNYSDGEYTQDYTTRKERVEKALAKCV